MWYFSLWMRTLWMVPLAMLFISQAVCWPRFCLKSVKEWSGLMWLHWSNEKRGWQWTTCHVVLGKTITAFDQGTLTSSQYFFPFWVIVSPCKFQDMHAYNMSGVFATVCCSYFSSWFHCRVPLYTHTAVSTVWLHNTLMNSSQRHTKAPQGLSKGTVTLFSPA